jgi:SIR2-like protein
VFVGAGVSIPPPSSLPDFKSLADQIAEDDARRPEEPLDRYLGQLLREGIPVHERAARILDKPGSQPTELHRLLVALFPNPDSVRIVTTNFDSHFEEPLKERWPGASIGIFSAPALPVGSEFSGLAYVHGRLGGSPTRLVLTDSDFGRAYLTQGWARRFLTGIFSTYDVLFVGYSHEDVVLTYLARGLPPSTGRLRFAFTQSGDSARWRSLDITPIEYEPSGGHAALREGLTAWLDLEGRGALGHEREIQQRVERPPQTLTGDDEDYLRFCLRDAKLAQFFYRYVNDAAWLTWASGGVTTCRPI